MRSLAHSGDAGYDGPAYVLVIGHVMSGVGKGTIASSLGLDLKAHGFRVSVVKIDPYLNRDSGTMSPYEHGECYVLEDGTEGDLDLGNYERFVGVRLSREHSITTGQIYEEVMRRERAGEYLGKTVQVIPHITDHIRERIEQAARVPVAGGKDGQLRPPEVVIVELGGTVGDMESLPFLHTLAHFEASTGAPVCYISVGMVVENNGELKTKPLQRSVTDLNHQGIRPDALVVRCNLPSAEFPDSLRAKISRSCNIPRHCIVISGKVRSIYDVPKLLYDQRLPELVCRKLRLLWRGTLRPNWGGYHRILEYLDRVEDLPRVRVGIVAKYTGTPDTYLSLTRALEHAAFAANVKLEYGFVNAELLETAQPMQLAEHFDRVLVPGGFGDRGIEGKMVAIRQARAHKIPYLGICLGMQLFVIDHCRTVLGWEDANSTEFDRDTERPVIAHLSSYGPEVVEQLGGTMRLGGQRMLIHNDAGSLTMAAYTATPSSGGPPFNEGPEPFFPQGLHVTERHRHRYEVSRWFVAQYEGAHGWGGTGLRIAASSDNKHQIPEVVENDAGDGWWAVGCQFHPELVSRNDRPHPLFYAFLKGN